MSFSRALRGIVLNRFVIFSGQGTPDYEYILYLDRIPPLHGRLRYQFEHQCVQSQRIRRAFGTCNHGNGHSSQLCCSVGWRDRREIVHNPTGLGDIGVHHGLSVVKLNTSRFCYRLDRFEEDPSSPSPLRLELRVLLFLSISATFADNALRIRFSPMRTTSAFCLFRDSPCCATMVSSSFKKFQTR